MKYILDLKLKSKSHITESAVNEIYKGVSHQKENTADGYRLIADNMNDMGTMYVRTMASLIIRAYLEKAVYTDPEDGMSDCTDDMLCEPGVDMT